MKDDAIRTLLATRLGWINKHKARFQSQARQMPREYVSGESHFVALMTQYLPKWRSEKAELNRFILAHEEWKY